MTLSTFIHIITQKHFKGVTIMIISTQVKNRNTVLKGQEYPLQELQAQKLDFFCYIAFLENTLKS